MIRFALPGLTALAMFAAPIAGQDGTLVLRGGRLFDGLRDELVPNTGIVVRAGKILEVGAELSDRDLGDARVVTLADDETVLPGLFDLHAHYAVDLFGQGRVDERVGMPLLFLANGVTATFPAGEVNPDEMHVLRTRIDRGETLGPRILGSGPYFGRWRTGWDEDMTVEELRTEVDHWAELGVSGFKAKGIGPVHLRALIERAHAHGLTVTGHLGSGYRGTVNPEDAIHMGIDRVEHFLGGDALPGTRSAYASLSGLDPDSPELADIAALFVDRRVYFDATMSAYGYYGEREPQVFDPFTDELRFFTPHVRALVAGRTPRPPNRTFERIYRVKRATLRKFYEAGGRDLITLGTDHPSWGEFLAPFGVHRELLCFVLAGISPADALRCATINAARAMRLGDSLGTIEPGKLAEMFVVKGDPLADIRNARNVRWVIRAGQVLSAADLLSAAEGTIGPANEADEERWKPRR